MESKQLTRVLWALLALVTFWLAYSIKANIWRRHPRPSPNHCIANLKQIDGAKEQYALEHKMTAGDVIPNGLALLIGSASYIKNTPECPSGGKYLTNPIGENPSCSIGTNDIRPHVLPE
jgi:hypothetical protein